MDHSFCSANGVRAEWSAPEYFRVIWKYWNVVLTERIPWRIPLVQSYRTINSFSDVDIPNLFRFKSKIQLHPLLQCLKIPQKIILPSRHTYTCVGEDLLLVGLKAILDEQVFGDFWWIQVNSVEFRWEIGVNSTEFAQLKNSRSNSIENVDSIEFTSYTTYKITYN